MMAEGDAQNDLQAHEKGYAFFTGLMKWGTIVSMVVALGVVLIIAN